MHIYDANYARWQNCNGYKIHDQKVFARRFRQDKSAIPPLIAMLIYTLLIQIHLCFVSRSL